MTRGTLQSRVTAGLASTMRVGSCAALLLLAACATQPTPVAPPPPSYEQLLADGLAAQKAGHKEEAVQLWTSATRQNPAAKEPWLRMAQMHFDAADYGAAISEAQEALQRDGNDAVANGLLAVSGLRVSSAALARMHTNTLTGSTRDEAETLAKTLRELLGAPVLVPQPTVVEAPQPRPKRAARAAKPVHNEAPAKTDASAAAAPARDPFSALR